MKLKNDLSKSLLVFLISGSVSVAANSHKGAPWEELLRLFLVGAGTGTSALLIQSPLGKKEQ